MILRKYMQSYEEELRRHQRNDILRRHMQMYEDELLFGQQNFLSLHVNSVNNSVIFIDPVHMADFWIISENGLRYIGNDGANDKSNIFWIARMTNKEAKPIEKSIKNINKNKATDSDGNQVYGGNSRFVTLDIQSENEQNSVISNMRVLHKETGKEHGCMMIISFGGGRATLSFGAIFSGIREEISFKFYGSIDNLKDSNGKTVIGTVHSHIHDRGLSGQGIDEEAGKGDMANVANMKIPWYAVGTTKIHVGFKDAFGRVHHTEVPTGTNLLRDALLKSRH